MTTTPKDRPIPDEPIQWHLRTSRHDWCPNCKTRPLWYLGSRERYCRNCDKTFRLAVEPKGWLRMVHELAGSNR